jgi:competence protein ComEA
LPADPAPPTDLLDPYAARPPAPLAWRDRLAAIGDLTPGRVAAAVVVGVLVLAVAAVLVLRRPAPPPELSLPMASSTTAAPTTEPPPTELVAHAAGAVAHPGIYRLARGARVADLVDAAGGLIDGADGGRVNLAAPLTDGAQVYVPEEGETAPVVPPPPGPVGPAGTDPAAQPVDLNEATAADLDTLPGVGPATAQAILDWRAANGAFTSVDQLLDVRGIGEAKLAELRPLVTV